MALGARITNVGASFTYDADQTDGKETATIAEQAVDIQSIYVFTDGFVLRMEDGTYRLVGKRGRVVVVPKAIGDAAVELIPEKPGGVALSEIGAVRPL